VCENSSEGDVKEIEVECVGWICVELSTGMKDIEMFGFVKAWEGIRDGVKNC
jgi:hypothetical protein